MSGALICSHRPLTHELTRTLIGRQGLERHLAADASQALELAHCLPVDVVLVDSEMPGAVDLVRAIRAQPATRQRPVAVLARDGAGSPARQELLDAGATEILRLPPGADWDERLIRLLPLVPRREARHRGRLEVDCLVARGAHRITAFDLGAGGMLIECGRRLDVGEKLRLRFRLTPGAEPLVAAAWVVRPAGLGRWGLEFLYLEGDGLDRVRHYVATRSVA